MSDIIIECPICMEPIEGVNNKVTTECGHSFHCKCIMQNAAHNGFGCPYCRTSMAEEVDEDDDSEDEYEDEESSVFDEDALVSFRMFHQRINDEEVEEEPEDEWETDDEAEEEEDGNVPSADIVTQRLTERGVTMEDLVKSLLTLEHESENEEYSRICNVVYGHFRVVLATHNRNNNAAAAPAPQVVPVVPSEPVNNMATPIPNEVMSAPAIAEIKSVSIHRRREFMCHV